MNPYEELAHHARLARRYARLAMWAACLTVVAALTGFVIRLYQLGVLGA